MTQALNHYRLLGPSGLRVSPLCLGTMTFGHEWGWGSDERTSRKVFDLYADRGGNFLDTANFYTEGTSESYLGKFLKGQREKFVVSTKYTLCMNFKDPNAGGNHRKNMIQSAEASLKRLQTDYIDVFWIHMWEGRTPIEEIMRAFDDLVKQGKVLYPAVSDMPAWKMAEANTLAEARGWSPFIATQVHYNLIERTVEHEVVPMVQDFGLGFLPWSPLAGGVLTGKYSREDLKYQPQEGERSRKSFALATGQLSERSMTIVDNLKAVASECQKSCAQVALRWLLQKPFVTSVIIGAKNEEQLESNLDCLNFELNPAQMQLLDKASAIEPIFPGGFLENPMMQFAMQGECQIEKR